MIQQVMKRKRVSEGDPKDMYKITKRSNKDFFAEARIGDHFFAAQGKDVRDVIKKLIKSLK